jgi:hypothetical protein
MADAKISALTAASALAGTETVPVVQSGTTKKATVDQFAARAEAVAAPARTTWAAAGGAAPGIVCIDPFSIFTEADPDLGTGATQDSSWQQIGKECFGHFRIIFGTSPNAGEGVYVITGLPALPLLTGGNARFISTSAVVVDISESGRTIPGVQMLVDPTVDATRPILSVPGLWTDVGGTQTFTLNALPLLTHNTIPWAVGDIINVSFQFETA